MPEMPKNIGTRYTREWHFIPSATLYVCRKSLYRQRFTLHFPSILHLSSEFCPILAPTLFHILSPPDISRLFYFPQSLIKGSVLEKLFHFEWDKSHWSSPISRFLHLPVIIVDPKWSVWSYMSIIFPEPRLPFDKETGVYISVQKPSPPPPYCDTSKFTPHAPFWLNLCPFYIFLPF